VSGAQRAGLIAVMVLIFAAMVPSHQITPAVAIGSVAVLVALNRCSARSLPILMGVIFVSWLLFMTTTYLNGHLHKVVGGIGEVTENVSVNVTSRIRGSAEHVFVVVIRLVMTGLVCALAFAGAVRRWRHGYRDIGFAVITAIPYVFVIIQPYGGEMMLRAYLFALPGTVFFAAALFYPTPKTQTRWRRGVALGLTSAVLIACFLFSRYGNERMNVFTAKELEAVEFVYANAKPNALLVATSDYLTWKYEGWGNYRYKVVTRDARLGRIDEIVGVMSSKNYSESYLILTRSQQAFYELFIGVGPEQWDIIKGRLVNSDQFKIVYENEDAVVLMLAAPPAAATTP
jgi:hypothetical protein